MKTPGVFVGCAGWSLPRDVQDEFDAGDSHLARYATRMNCVEINSSFYRPHSHATYARWASSVPSGFRFCVKLPKAITHERRFVDCDDLLEAFLGQLEGLGEKLACILVQLPPSFAFEEHTSAMFTEALRARWSGAVAMEPRHASWFMPTADTLLIEQRIARALADPPRLPEGEQPGGARSFTYLRLHGSPRMYYSSYEPELILTLAKRIAIEVRGNHDVWCIFDNTAAGAAAHNALALRVALQREVE